MSSADDRPRNVVKPLLGLKQVAPSAGSPSATEPARIAAPLSDVHEQRPVTPAPFSPVPQRQFTLEPASKVTRQLVLEPAPKITRQLPDPLGSISEPGLQRPPLVIKGEMKKRALVPATLPPTERQRRRRAVSLVNMGALLLTVILLFFVATPLGHEIETAFDPSQYGSSFFDNPNNSPHNLAVQATATAIFHRKTDGYDPFANIGQTLTDGLNSRNWPVGQCTYWANLRYQELTGYWIPWNGNAGQWVAGARLAHWNVSQTPHVPSILVLMPGVQGASGYGHVAVVEGIVSNGNPTTVHTSNMNWYSDGGGFNRYSTADFTTGPGVYFVWHS